ncbi:Thermonuclease precursor [Candidatus Izimaplasma bacterium HR1]|jgi:micrococcal nuclease|uniref:thermonuclease family protein n=1 Tax=Candidatus Izimoplasma sp. HR1 TaxID=1541959 RepID=UPI0004F76409|nr:Thermonuclease precursor [Candidatus Izimaplasma bacterium HR1]
MRIKLGLIIAVLLLVLTGCNTDPEDKELNTDYTDALEMDFTYEGKNFLTDRVGEVTLVKCTDGDTATFSTGSQQFAVRFLGIDTPESTYRIDPWGKAASAYTCDKLTNATTIVLEAGDEMQDGYGRYLAWVWYDGRLLNLELIEQAFSNSKGVSGTKYEDIFYNAEFAAIETDKRYWGEIDPDYDYSLEGAPITVGELITNMDNYIGRKIEITGTVAYEVGNSPYLVDESGYGIYIYLLENSYKIAPGNKITISGLDLTFYPDQETGSPQLVGVYKRNVELISEGNEIVPRIIAVPDIEVIDLGSFVKVENVTVTEVYTSPNTGDYTITCEDSLGNEIGLHISSSVEQSLIDSMLSVGSVIDTAGGLSRYNGQYQLEMSSLDTVVKK